MVESGTVNRVGQLFDKLLYASIYLTGLIILATAAITVYEVVSRYVFNVPTIWTGDLAIYLLIVSTYLSAAYLQKEGKHVKTDLLIEHFNPRMKVIWNILTSSIALIFALILTVYGANYAYLAFSTNEYSPAMWRVLTWPAKSAIPLGGLLLIAQLIREIITNYKEIESASSEKYENILNNPFYIIPIYILLLVVSGYLYTVNGAAGMVMLLFVLLFGGVPIYAALGLVGSTGYILVFGNDLLSASLPATAYRSLDSYALVCLPLFVMVGLVLQFSKVNEEIFDVSSKWVGNGKGVDALDPFWKKLGSYSAKVKAVAMDMSSAYIIAVLEHLPRATIVFDYFHFTTLLL